MNYADRVKETTTITNASTVSLNGAVSASVRTFAQGFTVGMTSIPVCVSDSAGNWELGFYTFTNSSTLTRERILGSSNFGLAVTFPAGSKEVICTIPAEVLARGLVNNSDVG